MLNRGKLSVCDPELAGYINEERERQRESIELIASENFTSDSVLECLGSVLTNKYSEGQADARYYGGNQFIDKIEKLCKSRALEVYHLNADEWSVNVQPYSGSPANMAVYTGLLKPHDRIMGLDLPSGGHLTHGFYTAKKRISATSIFFESFPYTIGPDDLIDYEELEKNAIRYKPRMIICGASAYPREIDYKRFRDIANKVGSLLMCDMAHISGLVATQRLSSPFEYCDIVTTTTHKTLQGPRSGMIFIRRNIPGYDNPAKMVDDAVFPGLQGGPHNHQIAGVCHQLNYVMRPEFTEYINNVVENAQYLAQILNERYGFEISSGGTDNHLLLVKLGNKGISGSKMEYICELVDISLNKNTVYGDKNPMNPTGIRIGTSPMTTRGFGKNEFELVAKYLNECANICVSLQNKYGKKLVDFKKGVKTEMDTYENIGLQIIKLKEKVNNLARNFEFYNSL
jgi:glycine hydroxymethyltransferase